VRVERPPKEVREQLKAAIKQLSWEVDEEKIARGEVEEFACRSEDDSKILSSLNINAI
jgi:hypothetical protein